MKVFIVCLLITAQASAASLSEQYLMNSLNFSAESTSLDLCLENFMLSRPTEEVCFEAVKSLTQTPLNPTSREVLFSLLLKLQTSPDANAKIYSSLRLGLIKTHPELQNSLPPKKEQKKGISLELKAWKKVMHKKASGEKLHLLINGKEVNLNSEWIPPKGFFQWSLVTDSFEPVIRLSSFNQFAIETMQALKPRTEQVAIYEEVKTEFKPVEKLPTLEPEKKSNQWIWPVAAIVGIGIASSLQNKKVSVSMPSFR
jgi:hypothetical protein